MSAVTPSTPLSKGNCFNCAGKHLRKDCKFRNAQYRRHAPNEHANRIEGLQRTQTCSMCSRSKLQRIPWWLLWILHFLNYGRKHFKLEMFLWPSLSTLGARLPSFPSYYRGIGTFLGGRECKSLWRKQDPYFGLLGKCYDRFSRSSSSRLDSNCKKRPTTHFRNEFHSTILDLSPNFQNRNCVRR